MSPWFLLLVLNMMTSQALLGFSLFVLLVLNAHGFPVKGSKSPHKGSSGDNPGGKVVSHRTADSGQTAPVYYSAPSQAQFAQAQPVYVGVGSSPGMGYAAGGPGYFAGGAAVPAPVVYYGGASYMPGPALASQQGEGPQSSIPDAKWAVAPQALEEAAIDAQTQGSQGSLSPALGAGGPSLQSGETSNVVKEAELGSYQQETEEFGYPANNVLPGPGLPQVVLPGFGGYVGYTSPYPYPPNPFPYPYFDYSLLYGLYPPGTYTTFSKDHEKGKDYYQTIHYLKEHASDGPHAPQNPGTGQHKVFPGKP